MEQYIVTGMSCAACQARVEKAVGKLPGVSACSVSLLTNSMGVEGTASPGEVIRAVEQAGYAAKLKGAGQEAEASSAEEEALRDRETPVLRRRLILSLGFLLALMYLGMGHSMAGFPLPPGLAHQVLSLTLTQLLLAGAVMLVNHKFFTSGFSSLLHAAPNMDTLVALGSSVSFGWSVAVFYRLCTMAWTGAEHGAMMEVYHGELYFESAAMIPALITVGKLLEALSKGRTTDALKGLMKLSPRTAVLLREGQEVEVDIAQVQPGDRFALRPGERVPVDGVVEEGESAVDESALTGESIPVDKAPGDPVSAATMNQSGYLLCRATRVGADTTLSQIIRMVSDAAATKAPIARVADQVSGVFVPAVIGIALVVCLGWLLSGASLSFALARGITVLVISCPCALGLATPVAIMVGNGLGARHGILFKTSQALESAGKAEIVALDKTGTITAGQPQVTDLLPAPGHTEEELLCLAYALEQKSEHPLAKAVSACARERGLETAPAEDFRALPGHGLEGRVGGRLLHGGSGSYIRTRVPPSPELFSAAEALAEQGKTPLFFEAEGELLGLIPASDTIKPDSPQAIAQLRQLGLRVVMLTGDNRRSAQAIGAQAGVDEVIAEVLPQGKEAVIRRLQESGRVAMVGDGINDAPALTRADTGIAIGAGTDVAIDSADVVLMNSRLSDAAAAIRLSRATLRGIHQNLFWAFFYNAVCIPLAAGLFPWKMNPMLGAAAMSLSSFTVCMNALRINLFDPYDASHDRAPRRRSREPRREETQITDTGGQTMEAKVEIKGMMCAHCEATVKKALEALDFVESAQPSHETGTALLKLSGPMDEAAIQKAVEDKDYTFVSVTAA